MHSLGSGNSKINVFWNVGKVEEVVNSMPSYQCFQKAIHSLQFNLKNIYKPKVGKIKDKAYNLF